MAKGLKSRLTSYGDAEFALFLRRAFLKSAGYGDEVLDLPVVGIGSTASDFNPCHATAPQVIEAVKRGVLAAGGIPFVFPTISLHESFCSPTTMLLRNLMAMDVEEMLRAQPVDAAVLIGGCDKTVPAEIMGALSAGVPTLIEVVGAALAGMNEGERLGACTDCRRLWYARRANQITDQQLRQGHGRLIASHGTCTVMGTASTMACIAEVLGLMLPGGASIPAVHAERLRHAEATGMRAVAMARAGGPAGPIRAASSRRPRSATPWSCWRRWAGRPTLSSTLPPSPAAWAWRWTWTNWTGSGATRRCWWT